MTFSFFSLLSHGFTDAWMLESCHLFYPFDNVVGKQIGMSSRLPSRIGYHHGMKRKGGGKGK